jgi:hypothetical protein
MVAATSGISRTSTDCYQQQRLRVPRFPPTAAEGDHSPPLPQISSSDLLFPLHFPRIEPLEILLSIIDWLDCLSCLQCCGQSKGEGALLNSVVSHTYLSSSLQAITDLPSSLYMSSFHSSCPEFAFSDVYKFVA